MTLIYLDANSNLINRRRTILIVLIFFTACIFLACCENTGDFTLGEEFIESQTSLDLVDTFSVSLSTVILDEVVTSGTENLLIGNYSDDIFGKISSQGYFQIGIPSDFDVQDDDIYDSLNLILMYNQYYFGDTTQSCKISIHQLTEKIEADEENGITSKTTFSYDPNSIGTIIYTPRPSSADTVFVPISNTVGLDLFTKVKDDSEILTSNESFLNYFQGLVLVCDDSYEGAIIGFNATADDLKLILYTHRIDYSIEKINYEFNVYDSTKQFNHISHDISSTQFNPLVEQRYKLPSSQTNGLSFLQGGIGMVIRVDFPSLDELLLLDRGAIARAQLSVSPIQNDAKDFELPSTLTLYTADKLNRIQAAEVSSTVIIDEEYHEETAYYFEITDYIKEELADSYVDPENGLLIALPSYNLNDTFYRLIIDAESQRTKLKIYYMYY